MLFNCSERRVQKVDNIYTCSHILERICETRMHSSRMRTIRCIGRLRVGVGCLPGDVCTPPCEQNHRLCKNITFPQLRLRTVKRNPNKLLCIFHKKFNYMKQITNCCLYNFLEDVTSIPLKIYNYNK